MRFFFKLLLFLALTFAYCFSEDIKIENEFSKTIYSLHGLTQDIKFVVDKVGVEEIVSSRVMGQKKITMSPMFELTIDGKVHRDREFTLKNVTYDSTKVTFIHSFKNIETKTTFRLFSDRTWLDWKFDFTVLKGTSNPTLISILEVDARVRNNTICPYVAGSVTASPIVLDGFFMQPQYPLTNTNVDQRSGYQQISRNLSIASGRTLSFRGYIGTYEQSQIRRGFNIFMNEARARKYKQFLHYNSWFDIGYFTTYDQADAVSRIKEYSKHLVDERNVKLDGFLYDDGWDDYHGDWKFDPKRFPQGFHPLKSLTDKIDAKLGIWISPWGGYGKPHDMRVSYGHKHFGYEVIDGNFALSGPKYYKNFHHQMMGFISNCSILLFKIDGTGDSDQVIPGSNFTSDFDAATHLLQDMRDLAGDNLYVSLTTGTFATPAWLFFADNIWRGSWDTGFAGPGSRVQQWLTFRDASTYTNVVLAGPLFPINSLMLHGVVYATHAQYGQLAEESDNDFADQVWSYFATGTQLQEMYCTPALLDDQNWDDLAVAARWARANEPVLMDVHWIGGNPNPPFLQIYGHAAWTSEKSIIHLRNPSDTEQEYYLDLKNDLELPKSEIDDFIVHVDYRSKKHSSFEIPSHIAGGCKFILAPLENIVLSLLPSFIP